MESDSGRFVPKVHPATRPVESDDPLALHAIAVAGDVDAMFRSLIQEFAWMGWGVEPILRLFRDPFYPALYSFWTSLGEEDLRRRVEGVLARTGILGVRATVQEVPEEPEPELVQIGGWQREKGGSHARRL